MYPVTLNVKGRRCLVVGGGGGALRKVEGLVAEGAQVTVVTPEAVGPLATLAKDQAITVEKRAYRRGRAAPFPLVSPATDDAGVNRRVSEDAASAGVWVNVADDPALCTFHLPARVRRGSLQLSIASVGVSPFVVRRLRLFLERRFGPEWTAWIEAAGRFRGAVRALGLPRDEMERRYDLFFDATVDTRQIRARVPAAEELARWLSPDPSMPGAGHAENGTGSQAGCASPDGARGTAGLVSLVGAGPGDAGLLTLRGRQRLMSAEAVVYDRLAATAPPRHLPPHAGRPRAAKG